jgi:hypothetical protein
LWGEIIRNEKRYNLIIKRKKRCGGLNANKKNHRAYILLFSPKICSNCKERKEGVFVSILSNSREKHQNFKNPSKIKGL